MAAKELLTTLLVLGDPTFWRDMKLGWIWLGAAVIILGPLFGATFAWGKPKGKRWRAFLKAFGVIAAAFLAVDLFLTVIRLLFGPCPKCAF